MKKYFALLLSLLIIVTAQFTVNAQPEQNAVNKISAFPGAEGGGMYTTGGRNGKVYEVTTLADSGPGSLRDAVSLGNRTIVFRVSGTIELKSTLNISGSNLTIAGQTAPGDGICVKGYDTSLNGSNVIIRYIRFRPGGESGGEPDGFSTRYTSNVIIDHCSFSWGIDETASAYAVKNFTMQWNIISESLTMSTHQKGRHGYGAIWGGNNTTYHHNLLVSHSSRNPRFFGQDEKLGGTTIDFRNNVLYNWGFKSSYGGEREAQVNLVNNYYKYGPDTGMGARSRIHDPIDQVARYFISGNYIYGYPDVTADNWKGTSIKDGASYTGPVEPVQIAQITTQTAEEAYNSVLKTAGAVLPKRDAIDARIINSVINGTGRQINDENETGGWPVLNSAEAAEDSDHDGMPDEWEKEKGLDSNNAEDGKGDSDQDGYTNLEEYMNSIVGNGTGNPTVKITSPGINDVFTAGKSIKINAEASDNDGSIEKVEFYQNSMKLGEDTSEPYSFEWKNVKEGTCYITATAVDNSGTATQSDSVVVHVNNKNNISSWKSKDIGNTLIPGSASMLDGVLTLKGSGSIGGNSDAFRYTYRGLTGDGEITAKLEYITALDNGVSGGLMIRESLTEDSPAAMIEISYEKGMKTGVAAYFSYRTQAGKEYKKNTINDAPKPGWIKLIRQGDLFTGYVSKDGENWTEVGSQTVDLPDSVYIGLAVDANKGDNDITNYNTVKFSNITISADDVDTSLTKVWIPALTALAIILVAAGLFVHTRRRKK